MKVGDYVRTDEGIRKIEEIDRQYVITDFSFNEYSSNLNDRKSLENNIIKSSPNIIDLIEVGDYVNGHRVFDKAPGCVYIENIENKINHIPITRDNLGTVLTKELFESMEYKIGE